jgi:hypothetical protein
MPRRKQRRSKKIRRKGRDNIDRAAGKALLRIQCLRPAFFFFSFFVAELGVELRASCWLENCSTT